MYIRLNKKKCDVNFIKFEHLFFSWKEKWKKITASVVNTLLGWWCVLLISEPRSELWTGIQRAYTVRVTFSLLHNMSVTFSNTKYTSTWEIPSTTNSIPSWIIFRYWRLGAPTLTDHSRLSVVKGLLIILLQSRLYLSLTR